jgi:hypothetical protein
MGALGDDLERAVAQARVHLQAIDSTRMYALSASLSGEAERTDSWLDAHAALLAERYADAAVERALRR